LIAAIIPSKEKCVNKIVPDKFKNPAEIFAAQEILPVTYKEISARGVFFQLLAL
jgi:hypothetical protein